MLIIINNVFALPPDLQLDTLPVQWVGFNSATLTGNITNLDAISNATIYFQYKKIGVTEWTESVHTQDIDSTGEILLNISNLVSNTNYTYYVVGTFYYGGENIIEGITTENFTTNNSPSIEYDSITNLSTNSFTFIMNLTDLAGEDNVTAYVECYDSDTNFSSTNDTAQIINTTGLITINVTGLNDNEEYLCYGVLDFDFGGINSQTYTEGVRTNTTTEPVIAEEEEESTIGILSVQSLTYAAFGLLAIIILVTIAMAIVSIIQNGAADTTQLITIGIWAIGSAIVLFVGYIIISSVASGVTL